jgi:hypothetical protein
LLLFINSAFFGLAHSASSCHPRESNKVWHLNKSDRY